MSCEKIIQELINQIKETGIDEPIQVSKEAIDYLVKADSEEKKPFAVISSSVTDFPYLGSSETKTDETQYTEQGFLLGEIPEIQRSWKTHTKARYQLYLLPDRRVALFKKESSCYGSAGIISGGEREISNIKSALIRLVQF